MNKKDLKDILKFAEDNNLMQVSFEKVCEMWKNQK